jgi:hypothetical protein
MVENVTHGNCLFHPQRGLRQLRWAHSEEVLANRWMNEVMGPVLADAPLSEEGRHPPPPSRCTWGRGTQPNKVGSLLHDEAGATGRARAPGRGDGG